MVAPTEYPKITPTECRQRAVECRQMTERASSLRMEAMLLEWSAAGTGWRLRPSNTLK
jgi:hypothetical protein